MPAPKGNDFAAKDDRERIAFPVNVRGTKEERKAWRKTAAGSANGRSARPRGELAERPASGDGEHKTMNTQQTTFEPKPARAGSPRPPRWTLAEVQQDPHKLRLMTTTELAHTVHSAGNEDDDVTCIAVAQLLAVRGNLAERAFRAAYMELRPQHSENDPAMPTASDRRPLT